ncbi:hypothetical protein ACX9R5_13690 [Rathayibacter sp. CAU 1779]
MRFLIAILAFIAAAVAIGLGIAQRTVWIPPANIVTATVVKGGAPFTVIDGSVLRARSGQQTLTVSGSAKPFVAYGRTADVLAWIGDEKYAKVSYNASTNQLSSKVVTPKADKDSNDGSSSTATATPTPTPTDSGATDGSSTGSGTSDSTQKGPNPAGSDLWLEEFSGDSAAITKMNVPSTVSVIIASDGTKAAPDRISLNWPLDSRTPWAGPLIVGGLVLAAFGILMYILAIRHLRRSRGPRRGGGKPPKLPRGSKPPKPGNYKPTQEVETPVRGRRSIGRASVAVPVVLVGTLVLAGCSSDYWPQFGGDTTATPTSTPIATDLPGQGKDTPPPAVTAPQLDNIVNAIAKTANKADGSLDATLAATRFSGPALDARTGDYALRAKKSDAPAQQAIPSDSVSLALPQATDTWPRVVSAVVHDPKNSKAAPLDLVLVQKSPRDNYTVEYSIALEADAKVPDLPPANIGTSIVPPDSKLLLVSPSKLADEYGDVLQSGEKSKYYAQFDTKSDKLAPQVGAAYKAERIAALPKTGSLTFDHQSGDDPVAMATNSSGAIVATSLNEVSTVKPVEAGATVSTGNPNAQALTGVTDSTKGIQTTYGYQLLFYVPPAGSKDKIVMLGFTQALLGAKELG